ncbi:hypothetical protein PENSPDRAFT_747906 [Peniophora sp. CONT]|nr:hypothetical protein PENSPDRAFT_747906 [Peniophora sp. CONT]
MNSLLCSSSSRQRTENTPSTVRASRTDDSRSFKRVRMPDDEKNTGGTSKRRRHRDHPVVALSVDARDTLATSPPASTQGPCEPPTSLATTLERNAVQSPQRPNSAHHHQYSPAAPQAIYARPIYSTLPSSLHSLIIRPSTPPSLTEQPPQAFDVPLTDDVFAGFIQTMVARAFSPSVTSSSSTVTSSALLPVTPEGGNEEPLFYQELCAHKTLQNACTQAQAAGEDIIAQSSYMQPGVDASKVPDLLERAGRVAVAPYERACAEVEQRIAIAQHEAEKARAPLDALPGLFDFELKKKYSNRPPHHDEPDATVVRPFIPCGLTDSCGEPLFDAISARIRFARYGCGVSVLAAGFEQHAVQEHVLEPLLRGEGELLDDASDVEYEEG